MMTMLRMAAVGLLITAGAAQAQTTPPAAPQSPNSAVPEVVTPKDGVARGVIQPDRPVDPDMVTKPPVPAQGTMPVIKPPATAR